VAFYQFRITVKSDDEVKIRFEEPFGGTLKEARIRARLMWARTSYIVPNNNYPSNKRHNRDVYALLEVWSDDKHAYIKVWEHRGKLPVHAKAPAGS
jgi:hypothetical protein